MQKHYDLEMKPAIVGMLADLTNKTTDSYIAEEDFCPGVAVMFGTNPAKQVKKFAEGGSFAGVAMHEHKELTHPYYPAGYCAPVVTKGRVWVKVDGDVAAGSTAKYDAANEVWSATNGIAIMGAFRTNAIDGMAVVEIY